MACSFGAGPSKPNGPFATNPSTPKRAEFSRSLDAKICAIASEFDLPVQISKLPQSPSGRTETDSDRCIRAITYLFSKNNPLLEHVVETYRRELRAGGLDQKFAVFLERITTAVNHEKQHQLKSRRLFVADLPTDDNSTSFDESDNAAALPTTASSSVRDKSNLTAGGAVPSPSNKQSKVSRSFPQTVSPRKLKQTFLNFPSDKAKSSTQPKPKDDNVFAKPPIPATTKPKTIKRKSSDSLTDDDARIHGARGRKLSRSGQSRGDSGASFSTSSRVTSFATDASQSTVATSFNSLGAQEDELAIDHEGTPSYVDGLIPSGIKDVNAVEDSRSRSRSPSVRSYLRTRPSGQNPPAASFGVSKAVSKARSAIEQRDTGKRVDASEHCLLRSFPQAGLFAQDLPEALLRRPLPLRWECLRASQLTGKDVQTFEEATDEEHLYCLLEMQDVDKSFERTPQKVWQALGDPETASDISYKLKLDWSSESGAKTLLTNQMPRLSRDSLVPWLHKHFGSHRFLYVDIPDFRAQQALPGALKRQDGALVQKRLLEWLCTEKRFLGNTWQPFHIKPTDRKALKKQRYKGSAYRVVMFATEGPGIDPITLYQFLDFVISLRYNGHQPFCKAYSRLDLWMSSTVPTIRFLPSQVTYIDDILANGAPECGDFDDGSLPFPQRFDPRKPVVMTDGCSTISVGAAKLICRMLNIMGSDRPVTFQARINGCKGMWSISAPYDTTNRRHLDVWIHVRDSQRKIVPRPEDRDDDTCQNPDIWQFEVLRYSHHPPPSTLYMEFLPILADRHVPKSTICQIVSSQVDSTFQDLYHAIEDPAKLRNWIHSQKPLTEDRTRLDSAAAASSGMPTSNIESIIMLLESGFHPRTCRHLANSLQRLVEIWVHDHYRDQLRVRLPRSTVVFAVADPYDCLEPGEIHLCFSETFRDDDASDPGCWPFLKGELLVARQPALRASDIQKVRAVFKEELGHFVDVAVFSTRGQQPLADKLQGGDYDGDKFWICWDKRLVDPFKNAPPPHDCPPPAKFGIKADQRALANVLQTGEGDGIKSLVSQVFAFKLQEPMLGQITNRHKSLAWERNSLSDRDVNALADLHDHTIDSEKNGYTFSEDTFTSYLRDTLKIPKRGPKPAYEVAMSGDDTRKPTPRPGHVVDDLWFHIIVPKIAAMLSHVKHLLSSATDADPTLTQPYHSLRRSAESVSDQTLLAVLDNLLEDLNAVSSRWSRTYNPGTDYADERSKPRLNRCEEECLALYSSILPRLPPNISLDSHPLLTHFLSAPSPLTPSPWALVRASALWHKQHESSRWPRSPAPCFRVSGRELCWIKALACREGVRPVVWGIWAGYRPRRVKTAAVLGGLAVGGSRGMGGTREGGGGVAGDGEGDLEEEEEEEGEEDFGDADSLFSGFLD